MKILSLGQKLRRLRKEKGLTLEALGGNHVSKAHLSIIENGKASPSIELLKYLCNKLDVDLEFLLETEKEQALRFTGILLKEMELSIKLNKLEDAMKAYEEIQQIAVEYDLLDVLGESNMLLAQCFINLKDYEQALSYTQRGIYYSTKGNNDSRIITGFTQEGDIYKIQENHRIAIQKYKQALSFYNDLKHEDLELKVRILHSLSSCYYKINSKEMAFKYVEEAHKINEIINNPKEYIENLITYSHDYVLNREYNKAKKTLIKAQNLLENEEQDYEKGYIECNLGAIYLESEEYDKALKHLQKSKDIMEKNKMEQLPEVLYHLYDYYLKKDQLEKAFEQLGHAIRFSDEMCLINYKIQGLKIYINYYLKQNRYEEACEKLLELSDTLNNINNKNDLMNTYLKLGNVFSVIGKRDQSMMYFTKAHDISNF
ncbi:MAG: helix-turn-helix transcriptional regulator [Firmicutes bacterium]|nr:helix-turn-helix transcriptional regulator [Bacillota bacterium]